MIRRGTALSRSSDGHCQVRWRAALFAILLVGAAACWLGFEGEIWLRFAKGKNDVADHVKMYGRAVRAENVSSFHTADSQPTVSRTTAPSEAEVAVHPDKGPEGVQQPITGTSAVPVHASTAASAKASVKKTIPPKAVAKKKPSPTEDPHWVEPPDWPPAKNPGDPPQIHFFSFGVQKYGAAAQRVRQYAKRIGFFDGVHVYGHIPRDIEADPKWHRHIKAGRGAGFWFWKSAIGNQLLKKMGEGDVLFYMDAGANFGNVTGWGKVFDQLCQYDMILWSTYWPETMFTKGDVFEAFGVETDDRFLAGPHQAATYFILKNNARTRKLVKFWEKLAADFHLISDEPSMKKNGPLFKTHRHDQSLLSMLVKAQRPDFTQEARVQLARRKQWYAKGGPPSRSEWPVNPRWEVPGLRVLVDEDIGYPPKATENPFIAARDTNGWSGRLKRDKCASQGGRFNCQEIKQRLETCTPLTPD
eukprot:gnl/TRDRNA2_/TRDRNA2_92728_c0_seq1.p1 gnl/TRDRNA2_/TRDRNA2_92728_c0~~gnl/TRDRNA2_/TRDRNA2_92728_c0_seq1.p1  ORF type:complete len:473 (+),score=68.02 gnl/TRDRNA2_/TRDRNA2_92728_c0_seq1:78-1496(+)